MPPFVPYPKIVDNLAAWNGDEAARRALDKQVWVASEKIHGANLCICTDGVQLVVAKRRAVLDATEPFFTYKRAIAPLVPGVRPRSWPICATRWTGRMASWCCR